MRLMLIKACNSISFHPGQKKQINLTLILKFHLPDKHNKSTSCRQHWRKPLLPPEMRRHTPTAGITPTPSFPDCQHEQRFKVTALAQYLISLQIS